MERGEGNAAREFSTHDIALPNTDSTNQASGSTSNVSANSSSPTSHRNQCLGKYPLDKKAYVLVFHHYSFRNPEDDRQGSKSDMEKIKTFFQDYRIHWNVNDNKSVAEVRSIMDNISNNDFTDYSCLIIIIMSHGHENERIEAYDGERYGLEEDIVEKCALNRTLDGKPKLFIVQACRGDSVMATDSTRTLSNRRDILTFQSTYKGFYSYRHPQNGTFFIQHFFDLLDQHRDEDISNINKYLNEVFTQKEVPQVPIVSSTFKKNFIFGDLRRH